MTKGDRIGHLCIMSRANVDHTITAHLAEQFGYLESLQQIANDGGYIMPETEEAIGMTNSATDLIRLAKRIMELRNQLISNEGRLKLKIV